ncbi:hypothetical protein GF326_11660 [Candidatus Bathyarchaeota archaeon]|nr:hypothetical protein [Candidatus Bathyarchaeota archaeon]
MTPVSSVLLLGLMVFWGVSLRNVLINSGTSDKSSNESPMSLWFILALSGSLLLFAESIALIAIDLRGVYGGELNIVSGGGLGFFLCGCLLHSWSVMVRGRYSVSWGMSDDHRLITDPPYSIVRHPSYLAYFLMIIGVTLTWRQWYTLLPWVAIPGYYQVSKREEEMLLERFGDQYKRYREKVPGFIPRT